MPVPLGPFRTINRDGEEHNICRTPGKAAAVRLLSARGNRPHARSRIELRIPASTPSDTPPISMKMTPADLTTSPRPQSSVAAGAAARLPLDPMDPQLTSIQPGGGVVIQLEMAWGRVRRWWLKTFRRGYVARMERLRLGDVNPCPHEVLDPRDLKFHRNQAGWHWRPEDDPFAWRDRLPFARVGLAELLVFSVIAFGGAAKLALLPAVFDVPPAARHACWAGAAAFGVMGVLIAWFFRNPRRVVPQGAGVVVSPADGKVVAIEEIEHDDFLGGPAVQIGIFLSIFNVHINRSPVAARVIGLLYRKGKFLNALRPESARENEQLAVRIESDAAPHRRMIVRQITGAIARRIVCWLKPGDELSAGEQFGMIKLGSRTELVLPREEGLEIVSRLGDSVKAGSSVLARYAKDTRGPVADGA
jgi:phosphatidylserine decarboxylase